MKVYLVYVNIHIFKKSRTKKKMLIGFTIVKYKNKYNITYFFNRDARECDANTKLVASYYPRLIKHIRFDVNLDEFFSVQASNTKL